MNYIPHTDADVSRALAAIGLSDVAELFQDVPKVLKDVELKLPSGMDEARLLEHLRGLAAKNRPGGTLLGGGVRQHFIPSVTPHLALRSEFVTAYTPYQAEVAQGVLQATFEYQTIMSELTGLPVSNASMYDGATAVAEAALLALRQTRRNSVLVSRGVHPESREVLATYLEPIGARIETIDLDELTTPPPQADEDVACVIAQNPNYLGYLEPMPALSKAAHANGALFIAVVDPLSLAVLRSPGEYGADIAVGDGQSLGNAVNLGGPHFGFMVVGEALLRQLPGRLVGQTVDAQGRRAFVLTLQAREQHIRRSKAKSNICSNHQLTALMAAVNVSALGPAGLRDVAAKSAHNAHSLAERLTAADLAPLTGAAFFNEFVLPSPLPAAKLRSALARRGVQAGVPVAASYQLGDAVVLSATELTGEQEMAELVSALSDIARDARPMETAHD